MKNYIKTALSVALLLLLGACGKESPFNNDGATGSVYTRGLAVEIAGGDDVMELTRAEGVNIDDFTVEFIPQGSSAPVKSFRYGDMPEIVELPLGTYSARASYGANPSAAWNAPYYTGTTLSSFQVVENQITDVADPIVCYLSNVKVTVFFTDQLAAVMSPSAKVSVKVGESGQTLDFTLSDQGKEGYFAYTEGSSTLAAVFSGEVEGFMTTETKVYDNVRPGNHYKITFTLHTPDEQPGDVAADLQVDATVAVEDVNRSIDSEDEILVDDMRPKEEGGETPPPAGPAPEVWAQAPVDLDAINDIVDGQEYILFIQSKAVGGIKTFTVDIESEVLSSDILNEVGLSSHLDLVNPAPESVEGISSLGLPIYVGGSTDVLQFNITEFAPILGALGSGVSRFRLSVSDANGTTVKTLSLRVK